MSRFLEPEPWLKAKIDPAALAQTAAVHDRRREYCATHGPEAWNKMIASGDGSRKRMADRDALPPEWRRFCDEHDLRATQRAMHEFGARGVKRATILTGIKLGALDL